MEVKFTYSRKQLEAAVKFIGTNNPSFIGHFKHIRDSILSHMHELAAQFPNSQYIATMGYQVRGDILSQESIDEEANIVMFEIAVDPSLSQDTWGNDDAIDTIIKVVEHEPAPIT